MENNQDPFDDEVRSTTTDPRVTMDAIRYENELLRACFLLRSKGSYHSTVAYRMPQVMRDALDGLCKDKGGITITALLNTLVIEEIVKNYRAKLKGTFR